MSHLSQQPPDLVFLHRRDLRRNKLAQQRSKFNLEEPQNAFKPRLHKKLQAGSSRRRPGTQETADDAG